MGTSFEEAQGVEAFWQAVAARVRAWLLEQQVDPRDAVVLLPFVQHLPLARRAFGAGWAPRIETTRSLAASLGPSALAEPGQPSGDAATDALLARQLVVDRGLSSADVPGGERGLRLLCARVVELTHALIARAAQVAPAQREAWWQLAQRELAAQEQGAPAWEALFANLALAWAQTAPAPATDRLFKHPAKAWVLVEAGGPDPLARELLACGAVPSLRIDADAVSCAWRLSAAARGAELLAQDGPDLASLCAQQVLHGAGQGVVALIALDRSLVRQVLALLQPYGLRIQDETGATLSAQPAAAALMHLLRAALGGGMDDLLGWLKGPLAPATLEPTAVAALESWARQHARAQWRGSRAAPEAAQPALRLARECLDRFDGPPRSLRQWLLALRDLLERCGLSARAVEQADLAALAEALWLTRNPWPGSATEAALSQVRVSAADWLDWVDERLRAASVTPPCAGSPQLVITPLARALLRPFSQVLLAGCDHQRMALGRAAPALVSDGVAERLGLPHREQALQAQWACFTQLLRAPAWVLLRARSEGSVALEPGWPLQRLLALGAQIAPGQDGRGSFSLPPEPISRAAVSLSGWLPERLSAAAAESLRTCPYRFFAQRRLRLNPNEELDLDPDGRDLGQWLHAQLDLLHQTPFDAQDPPAACRHWEACSTSLLARLNLGAGDALTLLALLQRWRDPYLRWWAARDLAGARVAQREWRLAQAVWDAPPLASVLWEGVIDRVDGGAQQELLDYKTGSAASLKARLSDPLEDTQLLFYAGLLQRSGHPVDAAAYLALGSDGELQRLAHPEVATHAATLRAGLAEDLLALHGGTPVRALGEGAACEFCDARGLCRRDDWSDSE